MRNLTLLTSVCTALLLGSGAGAQEKPSEDHSAHQHGAPNTKSSDMEMHQMKGMMSECMSMHKNGKMCDHKMMQKCKEKMGKGDCEKMMKEAKTQTESTGKAKNSN